MSASDFLNYAGAFANIVGLIGMFKTERQQNHLENQYDAFLKWLEENHHQDMLNAIQQNHSLINSLQNLLQSNHDELLAKIEKIDTLLLEISSNINGFKQLATSFSSQLPISKQAKSILYQLNISGGSCFSKDETNCGITLTIVDGNANEITLIEPRFLEDDLQQLCSYGLLIQCNNDFYITRLAAQFIT